MKFIIEHSVKNKHFTVTADDEQAAWEHFLDHLLPLKDNGDDYTITTH